MSESLLVTYCAPTLAGLKTGNLFNCTCTGRRQAEETVRQWKVYHDEQNARKTFCKFKKCTDIYCQMLGKGTPLRRLTVAG